jgi:hypothetical protein
MVLSNFMKHRFWALWVGFSALFLSGCHTTIDNMTPPQLPQNSSHIYTMTMSVHIPSRDVIQQSLRPFIIIEGKRQAMKRSELGNHIFVYDYRMSRTCDKIRYYYEVEYDVSAGNKIVTKIERSQLYEFQITGRCVLSLDVYRGIPGTKVILLGRGFQDDDGVVFGDVLAETYVQNDHVIEFTVPAIEADKSYGLNLQGAGGTLCLGDFFVDLAPIYASENALHLCGEKRKSFTVSVDYPVPANGLILNITTDIPEDIVMPEVMIPGGACSVKVFLSGNHYEASGHLFIEALGYQQLIIPVTVQGETREPVGEESSDRNISEEEVELSAPKHDTDEEEIVIE